MQYRSGTNPHEPLDKDAKSTCWKFILRNAIYPRLPEAFVPHVNFVAWLASPQGRTNTWLIRGYIQFLNRQSYYTLKCRYSKDTEWIPVDYKDLRPYNEFTTDVPPHNAVRFIHGVPLGQYPVKKTVPLQKVGFNVVVPDLIEDYHSVLFLEESGGVEEYVPEYTEQEERIAAKRELELDQEFAADHVTINPYTGEEISGVYKGHYWIKEYSNKRKKF